MALSFKPSSPVLYFRPRAHTNPGKRNERVWLLWPVLVYRVVAPDVTDRKLNVFEEAVLGMCCCPDNPSLQDIADSLSLELELVAYIAKNELVERGFLEDSSLRPTEAGQEHIRGRITRTSRTAVGYVFQDPWSLQLWPKFREQLDFIELEYGDNGFPDLLLGGSKGRPWRQHAHCLIPPDISVPKPSAEDILKAVQAESKLRMNSGKAFYADDDDEVVERLNRQYNSFQQVSFVDEEPEPHFLATYLYVPHDDTGDTSWYACDPFGSDSYSMRLKSDVSDRAKEDSVLAEYISKTLGTSPEGEAVLSFGYDRAESEIKKTYELGVLPEYVKNELVEFHVKLNNVESAQMRYGRTWQLVRESYTQARRVLEAIMNHINDCYQERDVWRVLYINDKSKTEGEMRDIAELINREAARCIGFNTMRVSRIFRTGAFKLRRVSERMEKWALTAEVTLAIHVATRREDHPFRIIAKSQPDFIENMEILLEITHPTAHSGDFSEEHFSRNIKLIKEVIDLLIKIKPNTERNNVKEK